ncbi:UNVERIFIED_CONTAM: hypothetical protein K2H54_062170 [Gekko kuhli]
MDEPEPFNHFRTGEHLIAGLVTLVIETTPSPTFRKPPFLKKRLLRGLIWHHLAFSLAIRKINQNPWLLRHNITLGYTVFENVYHPRVTYDALLDLLSSAQETIPNYQCGRQNNLLAVLEGSESEISIDVSTLLSPYKVPQV